MRPYEARRSANDAQVVERPVITKDRIRSLARRVGQPFVSSVYLDVDGARRPVRADVIAAFERLADGLSDQERARDGKWGEALAKDLRLMREWLGSGWDRGDTRGLALFCESRQGWLDVIRLPWSVPDAAGCGPRPQISHLLAGLSEHRRFLVALVDRRSLRIIIVEGGHASELDGLADPEARAVDTDVELGGFQHQREEAARAHYRRAGKHLEAVLASGEAEYLVIGGPDESVAGLEEHAPRSVHDRLAGRISVPVSAPLHEIAAAARGIEETIRQRRDTETIRRLEESLGRGQTGVAGLKATLAALDDRRLATLLVEEDFAAPGSRCPACGSLAGDVWRCPRCGASPVALDDVVEAAVDDALAEDAAVEFVQRGGLERSGKIAGLLRF